jgi:hypothetical protein
MTGGLFPAAVHRVTRFSTPPQSVTPPHMHAAQNSSASRLSAPLLVRGCTQAIILRSALLPPQDTGGQEEEEEILGREGGGWGGREEEGVLGARESVRVRMRRVIEALDGVSMFDLHRTLVFGKNVQQQ